MRVAGSLVAALTLFGCGLGMSEDEQRLCAAGQRLAGAIAVLRQAVAEDEAGNTGAAQTLAIQALTTSEAVRAQMTTMELEVHQTRAWDGLVRANLQVGQAANSMLPEFANTHGLAREELALAILGLADADAGLPFACAIEPQAPITSPAGGAGST